MSDARWMRRALRLASLSLGMTWPNPGVGAVVVKGGRVVGEGRHARCGSEHAEVLALRAAGVAARGATVYVTLAPCTRHGRQPPCIDALRAAGVARVVAAIADPMQADPAPLLPGIRYEVGCEAALARRIHGGFLSRLGRGRPRITGKWAMTLDGCLAAGGGDSRWISSPEALARSRRRRRAFDAIIVGAGTARRDDPSLLAVPPRRHGDEDGPLRVILGGQAIAGLGVGFPRQGRIEVQLQGLVIPPALIDKVPGSYANRYRIIPVRMEEQTLVVATADPDNRSALDELKVALGVPQLKAERTTEEAIAGALEQYYPSTMGRLALGGAPVLRVAPDGDLRADSHDPAAVAAALGAHGCNDVLVEGGATVHAAWLAAGLYDRLEIYVGAATLGGGLPVARGPGAALMADAAQWRPEEPPCLLGSTIVSRWERVP